MIDDKLAKLAADDVWIFTKQSVLFDTAYKAAKLFNEIPDKENTNVETYFENNYKRYGIDTHRHRVLVIAQMFGLLTKTPLYAKGGSYVKESTTEMFDLIDACEFGSEQYNKLKTEQVLKVKIRAIIDTANNNQKWCILPTVFSYKVLKTLKDKYGIASVSLDMFYTYVMTCASYDEVSETVEHIKNNDGISAFVSNYKDRSRFIPLVQNNLNLFNITNNTISINENFDEYFNQQFMERFDIDELNIQLARDVDYTYFLTTYQGFDINLIDKDADRPANPVIVNAPKIRKKKVVATETGTMEDDDSDYVSKVDDVKEYNINENIVKDAYKNKPAAATEGVLKRYSKNPLIGKVAVKKAKYKCENNIIHETFISSHTQKPFMEAHHLIPISLQDVMWKRFGVNIDCEENIVSLCPNCHRAIHYSEKETKKALIEKLYNIQKTKLHNIGLNITLNELIKIYGI